MGKIHDSNSHPESKIKLFVVIGISLLITSFISKNVFLTGTPRINPSFVKSIESFPQMIVSLRNRSVNNAHLTTVAVLKNLPLHALSKGVYAGQSDEIRYFKMVDNETQWSDITLRTKSGYSITLRYPSDQPPTKELLSIIKSE